VQVGFGLVQVGFGLVQVGFGLVQVGFGLVQVGLGHCGVSEPLIERPAFLTQSGGLLWALID
jgi:hypothetical protein